MLGERIRERRTTLGLTQKELAKKLNISFQTVSKYEKGINQPDPEKLIVLSNILNCTTDYLLGNTDNPDSKVYKQDNVTVELSKSYPYELTPEEVEKLISLLKDYRFDINSLISDVKSGKVE